VVVLAVVVAGLLTLPGRERRSQASTDAPMKLKLERQLGSYKP
jgi:hypothetical protein